MEKNKVQTKPTRKIGLSYGLIAGPISKQLKKQKFKFNKTTVEKFEKQLDAIHVLRFGLILTDSMADKCFEKLHNKIIQHVAKEEGQKVIKPKKQ